MKVTMYREVLNISRGEETLPSLTHCTYAGGRHQRIMAVERRVNKDRTQSMRLWNPTPHCLGGDTAAHSVVLPYNFSCTGTFRHMCALHTSSSLAIGAFMVGGSRDRLIKPMQQLITSSSHARTYSTEETASTNNRLSWGIYYCSYSHPYKVGEEKLCEGERERKKQWVK